MTNPNWEIFYKINAKYSSKVSRSWMTWLSETGGDAMTKWNRGPRPEKGGLAESVKPKWIL